MPEEQSRMFAFDERSGEFRAADEVSWFSSREEGQYFERKSARVKVSDLDRPLGAFANANGGTLVVGIADDGTVTGFNESGAHSVEEFEQAAIRYCSPPPEVHSRKIRVTNKRNEEDQILIIEVEPSSDRVIRSSRNSAVYLREGDKSCELDHAQITALEYDKNERSFEDQVVRGATLDYVDERVVDHYKDLLGTKESTERVLSTKNFLRKGELTVAGVMLFAKCPSDFMPTARVRFNRFDGTKMETGQRLNIVKSLTFEGPIPRLLEEARAAINGQLREFQYLTEDGRFDVIPEYPEFAWFEGLVNALTHRDYSFIGDTIRIAMYDDRLEILSPGKLPNIVTIENMKETRYSRNPRIARTLIDFGWVRELNEGVKRIYDEMQEFFLNDPIYSEPEGRCVQLVLENSITSRTLRVEDGLNALLDQEIMDSLNEYELAAVQYVYSRGKVTTKTLVDLTGKGATYCAGVLRGLQDRDILEWHGSSKNDPSQFYSLNRTRTE